MPVDQGLSVLVSNYFLKSPLDPKTGRWGLWGNNRSHTWVLTWFPGTLGLCSGHLWNCCACWKELGIWPQPLISLTSQVAQRLKSLLAVQETRVQSLGREYLLEKEIATHSGILAWKVPWMEEPGGLQSMGSQRVRYNWATSHSLSYIFSALFSWQHTGLSFSPVPRQGASTWLLNGPEESLSSYRNTCHCGFFPRWYPTQPMKDGVRLLWTRSYLIVSEEFGQINPFSLPDRLLPVHLSGPVSRDSSSWKPSGSFPGQWSCLAFAVSAPFSCTHRCPWGGGVQRCTGTFIGWRRLWCLKTLETFHGDASVSCQGCCYLFLVVTLKMILSFCHIEEGRF